MIDANLGLCDFCVASESVYKEKSVNDLCKSKPIKSKKPCNRSNRELSHNRFPRHFFLVSFLQYHHILVHFLLKFHRFLSPYNSLIINKESEINLNKLIIELRKKFAEILNNFNKRLYAWMTIIEEVEN